jgi:predicted MFS family arabinose efflux permease
MSSSVPAATVQPAKSIRATALRFVILIGVVSFFADAAYEGSRSITGPYLGVLGASGTIVGIVAGFGELVGYGLRIVSGRWADRSGRYWPITLFGYVIQMTSVPLLALAGRWEVAAVLIIVERTGKAIRNPPRDVMLSHATKEMGRGWGFGVHEALDQMGALVGPLVVAAVLAARGQYPPAFAVLAVPAVMTLTLLVVARLQYPRPSDLEPNVQDVQVAGLPRAFWVYLIGAALVAAGFADFSLVAFHFQQVTTVPSTWIPIFYAIAMGVGGAGSLLFGKLFDRAGIGVLIPLTVASAVFAPLVFLGSEWIALIGVALWGVGIGVHESIMAAAVAEMIPATRRGSAYGIFTTVYGLSWFAGSALMGILYDRSLAAVIVFSVVAELVAIPFFFSVRGQVRPASARVQA